MTYNPDIHHRQSIRLREYDYSHAGAYFVTLCTFERVSYFEQFSQLVDIVNDEWNKIATRFHSIELDEYVIMPNHFHGIIICRDGSLRSPFLKLPTFLPLVPKVGHPQGDAPTLSDVVGAFKSLSVNAWLKVIKDKNINVRAKFWQNNFYEHVIRSEEEMNRVRQYIIDNPLQWEFDKENPKPCKPQQQTEKWMI